ncbi:ABC transporter ATP-binding protein [Tessaracoccus antarcticus]|uniref:ABC transporter ATP-binding protein n=2 Tax=Tessaracoccus antarcticus TaxID=2479848 RepID=A0A3M0G4K4_9ACTN|nr:ABC transporter ATP-binding protein [Tessaracoccus antarcticus]
MATQGAEVTYRRSGRPFVALHDVTFRLAPGERVGVVGGSGSGKTTLARLLLGLIRPSAGTVSFRGQRVDGLPERLLGDLRAGASMVFQDPNSSLNPRMEVGDIISEPLRSPRLRRRGDLPEVSPEAVRAALESVGLDPATTSRFPHQLSGGQRQRVAIARALVSDPEALVADEPVSALDVSVRAQVLNLLSDAVTERGLALVFISHDLAVVRHLCERVVVMQQGRVVEEGAVDDVFADPRHPYTRQLLEATLSI